ncbi:MAG: hypothetical protein ACK46X_08930, partial [Candidatus Sericytochromatia bacterium]
RAAGWRAAGVTMDSGWISGSVKRAYRVLDTGDFAGLFTRATLVSLECRRLDHEGRLLDDSKAVFRFWAVKGETFPLVEVSQTADGRQVIDDTPGLIAELPVTAMRRLDPDGLRPPTEVVPLAISDGIKLAPDGVESTTFKVIYNGPYADSKYPDTDVAHVFSYHNARIIGRKDVAAR